MIGRIVKFIIDTIMHGRILYDIYGLGWQLVAAFWDSFTNFLSHKNTMQRTSQRSERHDTVEAVKEETETREIIAERQPLYPVVTLHSINNTL